MCKIKTSYSSKSEIALLPSCDSRSLSFYMETPVNNFSEAYPFMANERKAIANRSKSKRRM
jgi:hypothetical protein